MIYKIISRREVIMKKKYIFITVLFIILLSPVVYILSIFYDLSTQRRVVEYSKIEDIDIFILNKKKDRNCFILKPIDRLNQSKKFLVYIYPHLNFYIEDNNKDSPFKPVPYYMGLEERIDKINISLIKKDGKKFCLDSLLVLDKDLYKGFKSNIFRNRLNECFDKCCNIDEYSNKFFSNLRDFITSINTTHSLPIITNRKLNTLIFKVNLPKDLELKKNNVLLIEMFFREPEASRTYQRETVHRKVNTRVIRKQAEIIISK